MEAKNYDEQFLEMGRRLKELREESSKSHATLSKILTEKYNVSVERGSLMNYEVSTPNHVKANSKKGMSVEKLVALADFYGVSTDYILGRSDIKREDAGIKPACEYTGLTEETVVRLNIMKDSSSDVDFCETLCKIIEDESFFSFMGKVSSYLRHKLEKASNMEALMSAEGKHHFDYVKNSGYYVASHDEMAKIDFYRLTQELEKILGNIVSQRKEAQNGQHKED